jgi:antitoxin (DNA-binding transcriptional repressor) of toxin-antitoxin stability system
MTTKTIDMYDAQHQLVELMAQVAAGEEIILTDGQTPRALSTARACYRASHHGITSG